MSADEGEAARTGRVQLLALVAVFVLPVAIAAGWYFAAPGLAPSPSVHGTLIEPARPLQPFSVDRADAGPYGLDTLRGHWTLVHRHEGACDEACRQRLYYTRQIRDALGEDRIRVERLVIAPGGRGAPGLADILGEHPRLTVLPAERAAGLTRQLPGAPAGTVFLVDPLGNLMLRFGPDVEPDHILDDLEHVLKLSRIG